MGEMLKKSMRLTARGSTHGTGKTIRVWIAKRADLACPLYSASTCYTSHVPIMNNESKIHRMKERRLTGGWGWSRVLLGRSCGVGSGVVWGCGGRVVFPTGVFCNVLFDA